MSVPTHRSVGIPIPPEIRWRLQVIADEIGRHRAAKYLKIGPVTLDEMLHPNGRVKEETVNRVRKLLDDGVNAVASSKP